MPDVTHGTPTSNTLPLLLLLLPYVLFGQELPLRPTTLVMESGTPVNLQLMQTISLLNLLIHANGLILRRKMGAKP
jgi:hypothetical protein